MCLGRRGLIIPVWRHIDFVFRNAGVGCNFHSSLARDCDSTTSLVPSAAKSLSSLSPRNLFSPPPQLFHTFVKELLFSSKHIVTLNCLVHNPRKRSQNGECKRLEMAGGASVVIVD